MNYALLVTVAGPILSAAGWYAGIIWLFWLGVAVCATTLFLNLASGVMKLPVLPGLCVLIAAALVWEQALASSHGQYLKVSERSLVFGESGSCEDDA